MNCQNPINPLEERALSMALREVLSEFAHEAPWGKLYASLYDATLRSKYRVVVCETYENYAPQELADHVESMAESNLAEIMWAYELGKKDGALSKSRPSDFLRSLVAIAGLDINEDPDQPNMYYWRDCDISYSTYEEALSALAHQIGRFVRAEADVSEEFWNSLSDEQMLDLARNVYEANPSGVASEPGKVNCEKCGLPTQVDDDQLCNNCNGEGEASAPHQSSGQITLMQKYLHHVLEAMQPAEELGGPEGQDYIDLMEAIAKEANDRIKAFRASLATSAS